MRKFLKPLKTVCKYSLVLISYILALIIPPRILQKIIYFKRVEIIHNNTRFTLRNISEMTQYRANTFASKEPETLLWIDQFNENSLMLDIGANIGIYSLYAAKLGHFVISIEPDCLNYALLTLNINDNRLSSKISAFSCAASMKLALGTLLSDKEKWGGALKQISHSEDLNHNLFEQDIIGFNVADLIDLSKYDFQNLHIKIDIDGNEDRVIYDECALLQHPKTRSILVELDLNNISYKKILTAITNAGFILSGIYSCSIVGPEFQSMKNHIFYKRQ